MPQASDTLGSVRWKLLRMSHLVRYWYGFADCNGFSRMYLYSRPGGLRVSGLATNGDGPAIQVLWA